ncbi:hypothetical protein LOTGIDRAFT_229575 [Lottia gigantea]|uniref:Hemimethylated DNA-binding domain-containing protein n=1 Tax=Lottia gigantea TaxID=225164 RepID=V3ZIK4_LOTGI|nr:hypothetical protein LOTGIDRAFT_229575 [Lottia gigantea]ESO84052.1 hypothetical protein LOTGIDRAFT_229575 [Lottia gigantea]
MKSVDVFPAYKDILNARHTHITRQEEDFTVAELAMPDRQAYLHLSLLLLVLPLQYFVSQYMSRSESQRDYAFRSLLSNFVGFKNRYFSWQSWHKWCLNVIDKFQTKVDGRPDYAGKDDLNGESPAYEVFKYKDSKGYFSGSPNPRSPKSSEVKFRVGQVIKHKIWGYRGVIIGWDEEARAPENWLKQMHPKGKEHWRKMPNYSILVDTRDRLEAQVTYVPQENIELLMHTKVIHPLLENYFEGFDGGQYVCRPWLKSVYPHDN